MDTQNLSDVINELLLEVNMLRRYDLTSDLDVDLQGIKREVIGRRILALQEKYRNRLEGTPEREYLLALVKYYGVEQKVNFYTKIADIDDLKSRAKTCLQSAGINYLGDLVQSLEADISEIPGLGEVTLLVIKHKLAKMGLSLGMKLENYVRPQKQQPQETYVRLGQLQKE